MVNESETENLNLTNTTANGFISSVIKPRYLKISGSNEKAGIDLFVNGRLREKDILKHMPDYSTRYVASYLYGQIHFNELDSDVEDKVFTSSREGVVEDNKSYNDLLNIIKSDLLEKISDRWDEWRLEHDKSGDEENPRKTKKERHARGLFDESTGPYREEGSNGGNNGNNFLKTLKGEAEFNIPAYTDCFISENLLRNHITDNNLTPTQCSNINPVDGKTCILRGSSGVNSHCSYCKGEKRKEQFQVDKQTSNTNIQIRAKEEDALLYIDYLDLAHIIDDTVLKSEDKHYRPLRNSVMHTSLLTDDAKTKLKTVLNNIIATVKKITSGSS